MRLRRARRALIGCALIVTAACNGTRAVTIAAPADPLAALPRGVRTSFVYESAGNPPVTVFATIPPAVSARSHVVLVMTGIERNADAYADSWVQWASAHDYIALTPQFDTAGWRGADGYVMGNMFTPGGELNPRSRWAFTVVEGIHRRTRAAFALNDSTFDLWGHSAGGQFVHRMLLFSPDAPIRMAIAANSGWYTVPDSTIDMPYGVRSTAMQVTGADLRRWTQAPMVIMRGTADTLRTPPFRTTAAADAQGLTRFARAAYMMQAARTADPATRWRMIDVPGVGHDQARMAPAGQAALLGGR